jgi:hypothetical protein
MFGRPNVRAAKQDAFDSDYRWFHLVCYRENDHGWDRPLDFPAKATSDYTCCTACKCPINSQPVQMLSGEPQRLFDDGIQAAQEGCVPSLSL